VEAEVTKKSESKRPFFKHDPITSVVLVIVTFLASQLLAGVLVFAYPALRSWSAEEGVRWLNDSVLAQLIYTVLAEVLCIWIVFKLIKKAKVSARRIGITKPRLKDIAYALIGYGIYFIAFLVVIVIASRFSSYINLDQSQEVGFETAQGILKFAAVYVALAIMPPIAEEILFRGFLFSSLRVRLKFIYAALITSVLFGIAHLQFGSGAPLLWVAAIDTFVLSMVLCQLREKTDSLWASIILHSIKNTIAFVALFHSRF